MLDNTIAWMVSGPIQDMRERGLRESAEARELRTILATARPAQRVRPSRTRLGALAERLGFAAAQTSPEPSCCLA